MIKEITTYTVICDNCGKDLFSDSEYTGFSDAGYVEFEASESDWMENDGKHYCTDCYEYDDEDNLIIKPKNSNP